MDDDDDRFGYNQHRFDLLDGDVLACLMVRQMMSNLFKSVLHNIGVVVVGILFASFGVVLDRLVGLTGFSSALAKTVAGGLLAAGFLLRVWATYLFYERRMKVISLVPQERLITTGPYRISRNPLYLGGNVFIFLGAAVFLGSPSAIVMTALNILAVDVQIRREERQLQHDFGADWLEYIGQVRRWI